MKIVYRDFTWGDIRAHEAFEDDQPVAQFVRTFVESADGIPIEDLAIDQQLALYKPVMDFLARTMASVGLSSTVLTSDGGVNSKPSKASPRKASRRSSRQNSA